MNRIINICLAALALASASVVGGCGDTPLRSRCDGPGYQELDVTLTPDSVEAGIAATVVVSFERSVFDGGEFYVANEDVVIKDAVTQEWIGEWGNSRFSEDDGYPPFVSGVVLSGEVIDDRSIELTLEFPKELVNGAIVEIVAANGDPHCSAGVFGEVPLAVDFVE
jgi:hypothetical protein